MTDREIFEEFGNLSEKELNTKSNKNAIIKRFRDKKIEV